MAPWQAIVMQRNKGNEHGIAGVVTAVVRPINELVLDYAGNCFPINLGKGKSGQCFPKQTRQMSLGKDTKIVHYPLCGKLRRKR